MITKIECKKSINFKNIQFEKCRNDKKTVIKMRGRLVKNLDDLDTRHTKFLYLLEIDNHSVIDLFPIFRNISCTFRNV